MDFLQGIAVQWLSGLAAAVPVGYAFAAGMLSAVNPCGFAMLPAYLALYLGTEDAEVGSYSYSSRATLPGNAPWLDVLAQATKAIWVTLGVTTGFVLVFGGVGVVVSAGGQFVMLFAPWIALLSGVALIALGLAMLSGRHIVAGFAARLASRFGATSTAGFWAYFVFGLAYATASLHCALPIFLAVIGSSLITKGFASAAAQFISYGLGMGLVVLVLTLSLTLFKGTLVYFFRKFLPYVERVSALLLVLAGGYIVYYWLFDSGLVLSLR